MESLKIATVLDWVDTIRNFPDDNVTDSMWRGQLLSKQWLIEKLGDRIKNKKRNVLICGGWYGILASMLFDNYGDNINRIVSLDINPVCEPIADSINKRWEITDWRFKAATGDMLQATYRPFYHKFNDGSHIDLDIGLVINTSCEHMIKFDEWFNNIPDNMMVVLQSNDNDTIIDHVNTHETINDFLSDVPLSVVHYAGSLKVSDYTRHMIIGNK